ncbi:MAG TPA: hypothetical protein VFG54_22580 [Prolixibacteraceae bacterium]|nr:hypothetical protein [Prolixibacteraceae bacterium]
MNLEIRKLNIIGWISRLEDESIIDRIEQLRSDEVDWWATIDENEKADIERGIQQADNGDVKTTDEVVSKWRKWL